MASSLIPALTVTAPAGHTATAPVTGGERGGLVLALAAIPDPRDPRGVRYPLTALLAVAVCAVLAGASSFAAITDWLHDLDEQMQARLGSTRGQPAGTTVWRLLTRLDAALLTTVPADWLRAHTPVAAPRPRRYRMVIAIDGKTLRGSRIDGRQVHLLSALDTNTGIVLAPVTIDAKSNEIPAFGPLLDAVETMLGTLTGSCSPRMPCTPRPATPTRSHAAGAHLLVQVKANQPTLFKQLKRLPWAQIPAGNRTRDRGHGRRETRTVKAVTLATPDGIGFPHAQQAIRITRTRIVAGRTSREAAYLTVSLPAGQALPVDLQTWIRWHRHIENRLHHVKDMTLREDQHQARTGNGPAVIATLRNTAIGHHRTAGATNIARATRQANHRSHDLITTVTSSYPTTQ